MLRRTGLWIGLGAVLLLLSTPRQATAVPMADFTYVETSLGGGAYRYDYTLFNTGDPVLDAGYDVFDVTLTFATGAVTSAVVPTDWDAIFGAGFLQAFSLAPGMPPAGADVGPGQSLGGFRFVFDQQMGPLPFEVLFVNPGDPNNPVVFAATTRGTSVAEPASLVLMASGALGALVRRRTRRS